MTREELGEKIKNEEYIHIVEFGSSRPYRLNKDFKIKKDVLFQKIRYSVNNDGNANEYVWCDLGHIDSIFSTEREAIHYLKYGNITRQEKLPFVTWNEFKNREKNIIFEYNHSIVHLNIINNKIDLMVSGMPYLNRTWEITEENFYKAYEYAKELFLKERE